MTREEALKYAKFRLECYSKGDGEYTEHGEFLVAAIGALDKQIPKKPVSKYKYRDGENVCPSCETENRCRIVMSWVKFCPDCGQAIDWEADMRGKKDE